MTHHGGTTRTTLAHHATRLTAALVASLLAVTAYAAPASAERAPVRDRGGYGDGRAADFGDIGLMRVTHGPKRLLVRMEVRRHPDFYNVYVDTDPRDPGPEYLVFWDQFERDPFVRRVDGFPNPGQAIYPRRIRVTCPNVPSRFADRRGADVGVMSIANRCLGNPRRVSLSLRTAQEYGVDDWAPAYERFGRPLARG